MYDIKNMLDFTLSLFIGLYVWMPIKFQCTHFL
jgi:hypothetical protein